MRLSRFARRPPRRPAAARRFPFAAIGLLGCAAVAPLAPASAQASAGAQAPSSTQAPGAAPTKNADPWEKLNRATFAFNDALDRMLARPAAKAYQRVVPEPGRVAVSNFVSNLEYPNTVINSALQGKLTDAGQDLARFVVNATVGVGGLFDPATKFGLPRHDEDFGQTLGHWGVPSGPYVVLPGFGPSTLRDAPARLVDRYTHGRRYIGAGTTEYWLYAVDLLDTRSGLLAADIALESAFDPYALVRNAYLQRREYLVRDGQVPDDQYEEPYEEPAEEPTPDAPGADASGATASGADAPAADAPPAAPGAAPAGSPPPNGPTAPPPGDEPAAPPSGAPSNL